MVRIHGHRLNSLLRCHWRYRLWLSVRPCNVRGRLRPSTSLAFASTPVADRDSVWLRTDERPPPADASGIHRRRGRERDPDWLRNLADHPRCEILVGQARISAVYERSTDPEADLRRTVELMREKYGGDWVADWYVDRGRVPVRLRLE